MRRVSISSAIELSSTTAASKRIWISCVYTRTLGMLVGISVLSNMSNEKTGNSPSLSREMADRNRNNNKRKKHWNKFLFYVCGAAEIFRFSFILHFCHQFNLLGIGSWEPIFRESTNNRSDRIKLLSIVIRQQKKRRQETVISNQQSPLRVSNFLHWKWWVMFGVHQKRAHDGSKIKRRARQKTPGVAVCPCQWARKSTLISKMSDLQLCVLLLHTLCICRSFALKSHSCIMTDRWCKTYRHHRRGKHRQCDVSRADKWY